MPRDGNYRWKSRISAATIRMSCQRKMWRIQQSGKFVVSIVYLSLFLDNMLLTVVVPIIPDILGKLEGEKVGVSSDTPFVESPTLDQNAVLQTEDDHKNVNSNFSSIEVFEKIHEGKMGGNGQVGLLFASKALVQLVFNSPVGHFTNKMGCTTPLFAGSLILLSSSIMFAHGKTFTILFLARSIHGIGSACISIAGMAMIADRYTDDKDRGKMMGITMGGIAAGVLSGYPFGSVTYDFLGQSAPFIIIAVLISIDAMLLLIFLRPRLEPERLLLGTSILKLMKDPYIILVSGAIGVSTFSIAVLEPCLPIWLMEAISPPKWQLGTVFIPDSLGYLMGTNLFGSVAFKVGRWLTAMFSLLLVGICCFMIPLSSHVTQLIIPHFGLGLGIGIVDAALMPLLASLVETRYVALYGTVYAIAQVAVCLAYSLGPLLGAQLMKSIGFPWLMRVIGVMNILYCPLCYFLRNPSPSEEKQAIHLKGAPMPDYEASRTEGCTGYSSFSNVD